MVEEQRCITRNEMDALGDGFARMEAARMLLADAREWRRRAVTEEAIVAATALINNLLDQFPDLKGDRNAEEHPHRDA